MVMADNLYDHSDGGAFLSPNTYILLIKGGEHGYIAKDNNFRHGSLCCWWSGLVYFLSALNGRFQPVNARGGRLSSKQVEVALWLGCS